MLKLRYRRSGEVDARPRALAPLGLVLKGGIWYLVAQQGKSIRTYRAANISDVQISDETFKRPQNFDLAAHWANAVVEYEAGVYHEHADVRLSPDGMRRLELLGPYVTSAAAKTAANPDRRGWVQCRLPIESLDFGVRELMRLGDQVLVIGPPALRVRLARTAAKIAKLHGLGLSRRAPRQ